MYATVFRVDLHAISAFQDRVEAGRSLSTTLGTLPGFVAFMALESQQQEMVGLCVCEDLSSIDEAIGLASQWQHTHTDSPVSEIQPISTGRVIAQRDF